MGKKPAQKSADEAKKKVVARAEKKTKKVTKATTLETKAKTAGAKESRSCKISGCKRGYRAKGYCVSHYRKWRQGEYGVARYKTCSASECRKAMVLNRHGLCEEHFQKYYVKGEAAPAAAPAAKPAEKVAAAS